MALAITRAWTWFVTGIAEAAIALRERWSRRETWRVAIAEDGPRLHDHAGRLVDDPVRIKPPPNRPLVLVDIPEPWVFRRALPPVAAQSAPFVDAFVLQQMERIAPWRAADALFGVRATPLDGDPTRLAIDVAIVPKRRIEPILTMVRPLDPVRVRLLAKGMDGEPVFDVTIGEDATRRLQKARRRTGFVLAGLSAGLLVAAAGFWIGWSLISDAIVDLDRMIAQRKAALMQARKNLDGGGPDASLKKLRAAQPYVARIVDTLAATLPDSTFLTDLTIAKDRLHVVGISRDPSELVPALEQSRAFAEVAFSAPSTRLDDGSGDHVELDMLSRIGAKEETTP